MNTFPNIEKRVESMTRGGVFLTNFRAFGNVVGHCFSCLMYFLIETKMKEETQK